MIDIAAALKSFIYIVSGSLLYPAIFLLSVLVVWILVYAGSFVGEAIGRSRLRDVSGFELARRDIFGDLSDVCSYHVRDYLADVSNVMKSTDSNKDVLLENLLQEHSSRLWKSLDHIRMLVRIGPGLGLIGTLIPMGTGLAALGQGDITKLSSDLVIAFTTTVVGLAIGLAAYFFYWRKKRWVEDDIRQMEFLTEIVAEHGNRTETTHEVHEKEALSIGR